MRLWSLHPKYLDRQGILGLWREGLLAQKVLSDQTKGYRNHPQLLRFRNSKNPQKAISLYLLSVYNEAARRGYRFDLSKIGDTSSGRELKIPLNRGQLKYEFKHLLKKIKIRDYPPYKKNKKIKKIYVHPLFKIKEGMKEDWEKAKR